MKIGQLAEFAGTTTRTVRHYHRLGLLPEPRRQTNGYRDYTIGDGVRLMRIRRLAASGVPLGSVAAILSDQKSSADEADVAADLRALISGIEDEQAALAHRKAALTAMLADAEGVSRSRHCHQLSLRPSLSPSPQRPLPQSVRPFDMSGTSWRAS